MRLIDSGFEIQPIMDIFDHYWLNFHELHRTTVRARPACPMGKTTPGWAAHRYLWAKVNRQDQACPRDLQRISALAVRGARRAADSRAERLCLTHAHLIAARLGFSSVNYQAGSWFARADSDPGAQIDLMFIRADRVITLCEAKYRSGKIGRGVVKEVEAKVATYANPSRMPIEPVLISASEITRDLRDERYFSDILTLEDVFG